MSNCLTIRIILTIRFLKKEIFNNPIRSIPELKRLTGPPYLLRWRRIFRLNKDLHFKAPPWPWPPQLKRNLLNFGKAKNHISFWKRNLIWIRRVSWNITTWILLIHCLIMFKWWLRDLVGNRWALGNRVSLVWAPNYHPICSMKTLNSKRRKMICIKCWFEYRSSRRKWFSRKIL